MIKIFEISGTPYEMGKSLGRQAREYIRAGVRFYKKYWPKLTGYGWKESQKIIWQTVPLTRRLLGKTWTELEGVSAGSGVTLGDLLTVNSMEATGSADKCTTIIAKNKQGKIFLAHNEDWIAEDKKWIYLVRAKPQDEPAFLSFTYGAWLPNYGINECGLAYVADSLTTKDAKPGRGLSQTLIGREVLRFRTLEQAMRRIKLLPRADGHAYILASAKTGLVLETTATKQAVIKLGREKFLVHTNFYQSNNLKLFERELRTYSRFRFFRVRELLNNHPSISQKNLLAALSDHQNFPESICRHQIAARRETWKEETIASLLFCPEKGELTLVTGQSGNKKTIQVLNLGK